MFRLAVISTHPSRWQAAAARLRGVALEIAPSADALPVCDAVLLESPNATIVERYLKDGKHVLALPGRDLSAPMLRSLHDLARQAKVRFLLANPDRYLPSGQLIRSQLDAGKLGEPGLLRIHRWGSVADSVRDLDLAGWYFGKRPNVVFAVERAGFRQIHLGFPDGGMALIDHVANLPGNAAYHYLSLIGSTGAVYADDHRNMQLAFTGDAPRALLGDEGVAQWCNLVRDFVDRDNHSVDAWLDALAIGDAVSQSLRTHQAHKIMNTKS